MLEARLPQGSPLRWGPDLPVEGLRVGCGAVGGCQAGEGLIALGCKSPSDRPSVLRSTVTHQETPI